MNFDYQQLAIRQRSRHRRQYGKYWPDKPASEPAVSRYPNVLAELDASTLWLNRVAWYAKVSMEIMASVMEDNAELSREELVGLSRCFECSIDYLRSPVLSIVDPASSKGKVRIQYLKDLLRRTEGTHHFFYENYSSWVLPALESGKPVTYAAYRWACKNLQAPLDWKANAEAWQQSIRTEETYPEQADMRSRIQQARERNNARKLAKRLAEINRYVDAVSPKIDCESSDDLLALAEFSKRDLCGALLLAIMYGQAQGLQAAGR